MAAGTPGRHGRRASPRRFGWSHANLRGATGFTLPELLVAMTIAALLAAVTVSGYRRWREGAALTAAARAARGHLALARTRALARRETLRVRLEAGTLETISGDGSVIDRTSLLDAPSRVDSARLRPSILRFNSRGQAAPGSLYLYRGTGVVRIVCNFLGRLRIVRFRTPEP